LCCGLSESAFKLRFGHRHVRQLGHLPIDRRRTVSRLRLCQQVVLRGRLDAEDDVAPFDGITFLFQDLVHTALCLCHERRRAQGMDRSRHRSARGNVPVRDGVDGIRARQGALQSLLQQLTPADTSCCQHGNKNQ
jgi:hypothetical protein